MPTSGFARVPLGFWPTPLTACRRLQAEVGGPLIHLKRDDHSGLAFGGNKTRKLEFLLGEALRQGAERVVTFGALQSNHARQTAAACAVVGLACDLVLVSQVDRDTAAYVGSGNLLLDDILGATVHRVADDDEAFTTALAIAEATAPAVTYLIEPGGSNAVGTLGYVDAAHELADQLEADGITAGTLYVATSTGGTAAGLAVGLAMTSAAAGMRPPAVEAVCVYADAATTRARVLGLIDGVSVLLGHDYLPISDPSLSLFRGARHQKDRLAAIECLRVTDDGLGGGYGVVDAATEHAIATLARTEGVLLDPVYTGKAFGHLLARVAGGDLDPADDVVFVHTGGQPGLFAYPEVFTGE